MTRILWLSPEVPEPGGRGGAIRAHHLLAGLVRHGLEPVVVAPTYSDQRARAEATRPEGVELRLVDRPTSQAAEAAGAHLRHPGLLGALAARPFLGWQAEVFWKELAPAVATVVRSGAAAAIVEHDFCLRWARRLPDALPAALATHNATWIQQQRDARDARAPRRLALAAEAARFRAMVRAGIDRFGWVSAVSDDDAAALRAIGARDVTVDPNGADVAALRGLPAGGGEPGTLLFCGNLDYAPNADAVRWLIADILPRVRAAVPEARLAVVGRGAPADLAAAAAADDGVALLGWVDDLAAVFGRSAVAVAPLRSGGGTRLKVVEALAAGRATVATTIGAEGLAVDDGVHLRLADTPDALAVAIAELLADPGARERLGAAGRALVAARYDWTAIADAFGAEAAAWAARAAGQATQPL